MPKLVHVPDIHLNEACGRPGHWVNSDPIDLLESANKGQDTEITLRRGRVVPVTGSLDSWNTRVEG